MKLFFALLFATSSVLPCVAKTLYLSSGGFGGTGEAQSPLRIASASMFDAVLEYVEHSGYSAIHLGEGVYETRGIWNFPRDRKSAVTDYTTFTKPIQIRGAGIRATTIRLSSDAITRANGVDRPDLCVLRFGVPWKNNSGPYEVSDLTVDCNQSAFPLTRFVAGGLVFHANNVQTLRVRVIGLRGTFGPPSIEAFGILINNFAQGDYTGPDGNNRIIDCVVESNGDVEDYVSPFYIGVQDFGRPLVQSEIVGSRTLGTGKKPTRLGVSLQSGVVIERFSADNVVHAIYNDVGTIRDATVRDSRFTRLGYSGPFIVVDARKERVLIEHCEFEFAPNLDIWIGLTVWDKFSSGELATDIRVRDCVFRGTSLNSKFTPTSIQSKVRDIQFVDNLIPTNFVVQVSASTNVIIRHRQP